MNTIKYKVVNDKLVKEPQYSFWDKAKSLGTGLVIGSLITLFGYYQFTKGSDTQDQAAQDPIVQMQPENNYSDAPIKNNLSKKKNSKHNQTDQILLNSKNVSNDLEDIVKVVNKFNKENNYDNNKKKQANTNISTNISANIPTNIDHNFWNKYNLTNDQVSAIESYLKNDVLADLPPVPVHYKTTKIIHGKKRRVTETKWLAKGWDFYKNFIPTAFSRLSQYSDLVEKSANSSGLDLLLWYSQNANESAGKWDAVSTSNAMGIPQGMKKTSKEIGLKINKYFDERRDPEKSLNKLGNYMAKTCVPMVNSNVYFGMMGYNGGPGKMSRLLKKYNGNLEAIESELKQETIEYAKKIFATLYVAEHAKQYGINIKQLPLYTSTLNTAKTIKLYSSTNLQKIAKNYGANLNQIAELNMQINTSGNLPIGTEIRVPTRDTPRNVVF